MFATLKDLDEFTMLLNASNWAEIIATADLIKIDPSKIPKRFVRETDGEIAGITFLNNFYCPQNRSDWDFVKKKLSLSQ